MMTPFERRIERDAVLDEEIRRDQKEWGKSLAYVLGMLIIKASIIAFIFLLLYTAR